MKVCQMCGKQIPFESRATKYCSPECRARVKYEKDRAWLAAHPGKAAAYSRKYYAAHAEQCLQEKRETYRQKCFERYQKED